MASAGDIKNTRNGAVILAGGDSKRLGCPKAFLELDGSTLIEQLIDRLKHLFNELTIVTDRGDLYSHLPAKVVPDLLGGKEKSPLRGIHAGLSSSDLPYQFIIACDMPLVSPSLVSYMARFAPGFDAVVPLIGRFYQPLHAFYSRRCIEEIESAFQTGRLKVTAFYERIKLKTIGEEEIFRFDPKRLSFTNVNTWPDYRVLTGRQAGAFPE